MARLISSGAEIYAKVASGDLGEAGAPDGQGTYGSGSGVFAQETPRSNGSFSLGVSLTTGGTVYNTWNFSGGALERGYWFRFYVQVVTDISGLGRIALISSGHTVFYDPADGKIYSGYNSGAKSSAVINDGGWHRIEVYSKTSATQASRAWELRLDGVTVSSGTNQTGESIAPTYVRVGIGISVGPLTGKLRVDDVAVNDDQGTSQNSWPGDGYVIVLRPTSDNSRGSWTGGAGGTTNLWDAIDNVPPTGATAPGTNTSQISANAVATTGKFNTATYLAAGAASGDTAVCCAVVANHGEQVATGTKSGSATSDTTNNTPSLTTGTINYGLDAGAEGAWPVLWRWSASPFSAYASQPALGTGAVLNIITTTTSRVADCCFLGLVVEMQAAPASPARRHLQSNQVAIMRPTLR